MEIKLTRNELLALLDDLNASGNIPEDADDDYLAVIVSNKIMLITDAAAIERALKKTLPMSWRGRLIARKIELERAAQAVRDAAAGRQQPRGNLVVNVPEVVGLTHFHGQNGRVACARTEGDRVVIDLFPEEFRSLLADRRHGLAWHDANSDLLALMARVA